MPHKMSSYSFKDPVCYTTRRIQTLTETKYSCTLPEINLLHDNSWFKQLLSSRVAEDLERQRLAESPHQVISSDHIAHELSDPDGLCELLAERFSGQHVYIAYESGIRKKRASSLFVNLRSVLGRI